MRYLAASALTACLTLAGRHARATEPPPNQQKLVSDDDDVRFRVSRQTSLVFNEGSAFQGSIDAETYRDLCVAPCRTLLPPGSYRLALSKGDDNSTAEDVDVPAGPTTIEGQYVSHATTRTIGWTLMLGGGAVGLGLVAYGVLGHQQTVCASDGSCEQLTSPDTTMVTIGAILAAGSVLGSLLMIHVPDEAHFQVRGTQVAVSPSLWRLPKREGMAEAAVPGVSASAAW
jgi:hypothetical protein